MCPWPCSGSKSQAASLEEMIQAGSPRSSRIQGTEHLVLSSSLGLRRAPPTPGRPSRHRPLPATPVHRVMDEAGHPPKVDDGVSGLEGAVQGYAGLAHQGPEGRSDAEDTLLTVDGELEVGCAVRLVLNPQSLLRAFPKVDPAEVDAMVLQGHIRTWAQETGALSGPCHLGGAGVSERVPLMGGGVTWRQKTWH